MYFYHVIVAKKEFPSKDYEISYKDKYKQFSCRLTENRIDNELQIF